MRKQTEHKFERPEMQTLSELEYKKDAKMGEHENGTFTKPWAQNILCYFLLWLFCTNFLFI